MELEEERAAILAELKEVYQQNEYRYGYAQIRVHTRDATITSATIDEMIDPAMPGVKRIVPIAKMINGDKIVLLLPSKPVRQNKTKAEEREDAELICSRVKRLLEIQQGIKAERIKELKKELVDLPDQAAMILARMYPDDYPED